MEFKLLPSEMHLALCDQLAITDVLSLIQTEKCWGESLAYQPFWLARTHELRIYNPTHDNKSSTELKQIILNYIRSLHKVILAKFPEPYATFLTATIIDDKPEALKRVLRQQAKGAARSIMPIAMQFERIKMVDCLFDHYKLTSEYTCLLHAIRYELYAVVKYFVEIRKLPLINTAPGVLLPVRGKRWDASFKVVDELGRRNAGTFKDINYLLVQEVAHCRNHRMLAYLKKHLDLQIAELGHEHPYAFLITKLRRHSLGTADLNRFVDSPIMTRLFLRK